MLSDPWTALAVFAVAALVIGTCGVRLARVAEELAERTGLGQAMTGALILGGITSLSGLSTSISAAWSGDGNLAISNGVGGIAAQTVFLVFADLAYRRANLEHAAAAEVNLIQGALLVSLLAVPILAMAGPNLTILWVHPASLLLVLGYGLGIRLISGARDRPQWHPVMTRDTQTEERTPKRAGGPTRSLWLRLLIYGGLVALAGYAIAHTASVLADWSGLTTTAIGALFTAVVTSLPELVTALAAVRRGALALAVGDILGGNCFDVLFVALSDFAYLEGSIYHAVSSRQLFFLALTIILTGLLLLGLLRRERHGFANIGFESALVLALYIGGLGFLFLPQ